MEEKHENRISPRFVINEITLEQRRTLLVGVSRTISCMTSIVILEFFESRMSRYLRNHYLPLLFSFLIRWAKLGD